MSEIRKVTLQFPSLRAFLAEYGERISTEGMLLRGDSPPGDGSTVDVEVVVAEGMRLLRARGEILWSDQGGAGGRLSAAALRFDELDDASRTLISKIVEQRRRKGAETFRLDGAAGPRGARRRDLTVPTAAVSAAPPAGAGSAESSVFDLAQPPPAAAPDLLSPSGEDGAGTARPAAAAAPVAERRPPPVPLLADPEPAPLPIDPGAPPQGLRQGAAAPPSAAPDARPRAAAAEPPAALAAGSEGGPFDFSAQPPSEAGEVALDGLPLETVPVGDEPGPSVAPDLNDLFSADEPQIAPARGRTEAFPPSFVDEVEAELEAADLPEAPEPPAAGEQPEALLETPVDETATPPRTVAEPAPPPAGAATPDEAGEPRAEPAPEAVAGPSPAAEQSPPTVTEPAPPAEPSPPTTTEPTLQAEPSPSITAEPTPPAEPSPPVIDEPPLPAEPAPAPAVDAPAEPKPTLELEVPDPAEPPSAPAAAAPLRAAKAFNAKGGPETVEIPLVGQRQAASEGPPQPAAVERPPAPAIDDNLLTIPELSGQPASPPVASQPASDPSSPMHSLRGAGSRSRHAGTWLLIVLLLAALGVAGYFLLGLMRDGGGPATADRPASGSATAPRPRAAAEPERRTASAPDAGAAGAVADEAGLQPAGGEPTASDEASAAPASGPDAPAETPPAAPEPLTGLVRITWTESGDETVLALVGDGEIASQQVELTPITGGQPRLVIKIGGVQRAFQPAVLEVGTAQVRRVRTGLHAGGELHVVVDLAAQGVAVRGLSPGGPRLEVRLGTESR